VDSAVHSAKTFEILAMLFQQRFWGHRIQQQGSVDVA